MARVVLLIVSLLALQDDSEIARWIDELDHDEIAFRDKAQANLLKAGTKALFALKGASMIAKDGDRRNRLRGVIEEIERPERERAHDARERKRVLQLHSVEFKEASAPAVLNGLRELVGPGVQGEFDPAARVSLSIHEETLRKILDAIEDQTNCTIRNQDGRWKVTAGKPARKPRAYVPGTTLDLTCKAFEVDGKVIGIRIKAAMEGSAHPFIDTWEARGKDGSPRNVRRCDSCGPLYALVESGGEELRVRLKGRLQWNAVYEFTVADPQFPQTFRVAQYLVTYDFPKIRITSPEPIERHRFPYARLEGRWKEGRKPDSSFGGRFAAAAGERIRKPGVWCDCGPIPKPAVKPPEPLTIREYTDYEGRDASDFESMKILFSKPVQEPFETEAVVPAD